MTTSEKIKLVGLLELYKEELAQANVSRKKDKYGCNIPTKALFTHARIISTKLSVEIEKELKSTWEA